METKFISIINLINVSNISDDSNIEIEYDYTGVCDTKMSMAKDLFETIGQIIGRSTRHSLSLKSNFYELGGNSLNSIFTVTQLRNKGYFISITDFISAENLGEILNKICDAHNENRFDGFDVDAINDEMNLTIQPLAAQHKNDIIE